jgi:putative spermidine/putrescine transport system permease protein
MARPSFFGLLLIAPALAMIGALFLYPLGFSLAAAFTEPGGSLSLMHFQKAYELYSTDILFTLFIVVVSTLLTGLFSIAIA